MLGVLVMNTGTPDAPTPEAIKPYLRQFLSDRNLINVPPAVWRPVLELCILPRRPQRTAPCYQAFWTQDGSPFMLMSLAQRDSLRARLTELAGEPVAVELGMRYGNPSVRSALESLRAAGIDRLAVLPLYPQNTRACAGTCLEEFEARFPEVFGEEGAHGRPSVTEIAQYWDAPGYLDALASSVRSAWAPDQGGKLVVSFHSIPLVHVRGGDTYPETTKATARGLAAKLGMAEENVLVAYQSRFDNRKWQGPFLEHELRRLADEGVRDVAVVCPIFSVDCLETVHDVAEVAAAAYKSAAHAAGMPDARFTYVPALGAGDAIMDVLANLVMGHVR